MTPIQLYTYAPPNGHKVSIMLEEVGLPYDVHVIDIERGDQARPAFRALNPNARIPVITDPDRGRAVFESGAILHYLAERSGKLLPASDQERVDTLAWTLFQAAHVGPTLGQLWHYSVFVSETLPPVIDRFRKEAERVFRVLDGQLAGHAHIVGDTLGIADLMTWPWISAAVETLGLTLGARPHLAGWHATLSERPAVQRSIKIPILADSSGASAA